MLLVRVLIVCLLFFAEFSAATTAEESPPAVPVHPIVHRRAGESERGGERQREGTRLTEVTGRFEIAGDRITFYPASGKESFRLLENLALERVGQVLSETRAKQEWTISGTLTEFRGANYLLLTKAVIKTTENAPSR